MFKLVFLLFFELFNIFGTKAIFWVAHCNGPLRTVDTANYDLLSNFDHLGK
jgi:hypothetical protein